MSALREALSPDLLRRYAGDAAFRRGEEYYSVGAVGIVEASDDAISAQVDGTYRYVSRIFLTNGVVDCDCTCPVGDRDECCKHVVALGLAWLAEEPAAEHRGAPKRRTRKRAKAVDLRAWLASLEPAVLVDLLYDAAMHDEILHARLMQQALATQAVLDLSALKKAIRASFATRGFVDYRRMRNFVQRAMTVPVLLDNLRIQHPEKAAELALYALQRGIKAYENTDDSGGAFGEVLRDVAAIHLAACREGIVDGTALARSLFEFQLQDEWGFLRFEDYAPLLGKPGLKAYRRLAEAEWKAVPTHGPEDGISFSERAGYFAITRIMEALEKQAGDVDALVAVKARDLSSPYAFLEVAELLQKADREAEALNWAERGLRAFDDFRDARLTEFVLAAYASAGRTVEATELAFKAYQAHPTLTAYRRLHDAAVRSKDWPGRRKSAWHVLDERLAARKPARSRWEAPDTAPSLRVEILLWENDIEAALGEAKAHGCDQFLLRKLAQACEAAHPAEAVHFYQGMIDGIVNLRRNDAYEEAAEMATKIGQLMGASAKSGEFADWITDLRARHRQKRNFMKALDAHGL